jgi:lipoprotein-releasing system permease protein
VNGKFFLGEIDGLPGLVIGSRLAEKLNVTCGDRVTVFGISGIPSPLNMPTVIQFRVTGIYETGMSEYDDVFGYTSIRVAQRLFQYGDAMTGFNIRVEDPEKAQAVAFEIQRLLGYPYYPRTIFQMYRNLFTWIELQKKPIPIVLGLIIIVATFNIIGTLLMMVVEKTGEIGILKSMGASSAGITKIFVFQGLFIGLIGTVLGNLLAYGLCWAQSQYKIMSLPEGVYYMNTVPISMDISNFALVSGIAILLCFLATLVPSFLASRLNPISSVRFS